RVELLLGDRILLEQRLVAREIDLRIGELGLVAREHALLLGERGLVGTRVYLGEQVALLHHLSLVEVDARELAADLGTHGHHAARRDRAQPVERDIDVATDRSRGAYRHRRYGHAAGTLSASRTRRWTTASATAAIGHLLHLRELGALREPEATNRYDDRDGDHDRVSQPFPFRSCAHWFFGISRKKDAAERPPPTSRRKARKVTVGPLNAP